MKQSNFQASLAQAAPPPALTAPLAALWWDRKGDWDRAHEMVAADEGNADAAWVHAYLHRKEGDPGNARYWYRRAGKSVFLGSLDDEWSAIAQALLDESASA